MNKVELKEVGEVPAKKANEFVFGDIIACDYGYTLRVIEVRPSMDGAKIRMTVEHVPEENEFYEGSSFHEVEYAAGVMLGVAEKHGNEGWC